MTDEHERMMRANQANWDARTPSISPAGSTD